MPETAAVAPAFFSQADCLDAFIGSLSSVRNLPGIPEARRGAMSSENGKGCLRRMQKVERKL
jgi:hypothetical protein